MERNRQEETKEVVVQENGLLDCCIEATEKEKSSGLERKVKLLVEVETRCCGMWSSEGMVEVEAVIRADGSLEIPKVVVGDIRVSGKGRM